jgi:hypothetical protein
MNEEALLSRLLDDHYPRVKVMLERYRAAYPEQWTYEAAAAWQDIEQSVPDEARLEWMALKGELSSGLYLDPMRRNKVLAAVRQRASNALAQGARLDGLQRYLCELALEWPAAFLPGGDPPFVNQAAIQEARAFLEVHPELADLDADALADKMPGHLVRAMTMQAFRDTWYEMFGRGDRRSDA